MSTGTTTTTNTSFREGGGLSSSAGSMRSVIRNLCGSATSSSTIGAGGGMRSSNGGVSPARMIVDETKAKAMKDRPDSKLTSGTIQTNGICDVVCLLIFRTCFRT
jgi:hypothetical protein